MFLAFRFVSWIIHKLLGCLAGGFFGILFGLSLGALIFQFGYSDEVVQWITDQGSFGENIVLAFWFLQNYGIWPIIEAFGEWILNFIGFPL